MREFYPHDVKPVKASVQIIKLLFGMVIILVSWFSHAGWGFLVGVLFLFGSLLRKWVVVDEEGVHIKYDAYFFKHHDDWPFTTIDTIHKDNAKCNSNETMLHFGRDVVSRRYVFSAADANEIIELALKANPKIYVESIKK